MESRLFRQKGIFFIPASVGGWIILVGAVAWAVYEFIDIDSRSHSVSDTLMNFVFNLFIIAGCYNIIGFLSTIKQKRR